MFTLKRCPVCKVGETFCICSAQPSIKLPFELTVLSNPEEFIKPTNTARLIRNACPSVEITEWKRKEPPEGLIQQIHSLEVHPYVLYPADNATTFAEAGFYPQKKGKGIRIILLDGTWKQSRKMYNHSEYLKNIPALRIETETRSVYRLRRQSNPQRLSTIEAVIELIKLFREKRAASLLSSYFKVYQWAYLHSKMNKVMDFDSVKLFETFATVS